MLNLRNQGIFLLEVLKLILLIVVATSLFLRLDRRRAITEISVVAAAYRELAYTVSEKTGLLL